MVKGFSEKIINFIKLMVIIFLFFNINWIFSVLLSLINIDIDTLNKSVIIIVDLVMQFTFVVFIFLMYKNSIIKDFKDYKNNFKKCFNICLKFFWIFFLIKIGSSIISYAIGGILNINVDVSENQNLINEMTSKAPIIMLFSASFIAPFIEESTFRLGLKKIISNSKVFIITSGLIFGLIHIFPTQLDISLALLQSITYVAMGFALAYFYEKYKNIWFPITIHMLNNLISVIFLILA